MKRPLICQIENRKWWKEEESFHVNYGQRMQYFQLTQHFSNSSWNTKKSKISNRPREETCLSGFQLKNTFATSTPLDRASIIEELNHDNILTSKEHLFSRKKYFSHRKVIGFLTQSTSWKSPTRHAAVRQALAPIFLPSRLRREEKLRTRQLERVRPQLPPLWAGWAGKLTDKCYKVNSVGDTNSEIAMIKWLMKNCLK